MISAVVALLVGTIVVGVGQRVGWAKDFSRAGRGWVLVTLLLGFASFRVLMLLSNLGQATGDLGELSRIRANAISTGISTLVGASLAASLSLLAYACTLWIPALVRPGPEPESTPDAASGALAGWAIGVLLSLAGVLGLIGFDRVPDMGPALYLLPVVSLFPAGAVMLASLRASAEPEHRARVAAMRVSMGFAGFIGIGALGEVWRYAGAILTFQAVAGARVELKDQMLSTGMEVANHAAYMGWSLALIPLLVSVGSVVSSRSLFDSREWKSISHDLSQALMMLMAMGMGLWGYRSLLAQLFG